MPETPFVDRQRRFPRTGWRRWLLRLALAAPFVALSFLQLGLDTHDTRNAQLRDLADPLSAGMADDAWFRSLDSLLPKLVALLLPGGVVALGVVGALVAGYLLQRVVEHLVQRRMPAVLSISFLLLVAANPLSAYLIVTNLSVTLAIAFFGLGLADADRFVRWGNTQAGFRAGAFLLLAAMSDSTALLYGFAVAAVLPFVPHTRADRKGVKRSNLTVLLFPMVAGIVLWAILRMAFGHESIPAEVGERLSALPTRVGSLGQLFGGIGGLTLLMPLAVVIVIAAITRRPRAIPVAVLVFATILLGAALGTASRYDAGSTLVLIVLVGMIFLPTPQRTRQALPASVAVIATLVIVWIASFQRSAVREWMAALASTLA